jgi:hypothetical protein
MNWLEREGGRMEERVRGCVGGGRVYVVNIT